MAFSESLGLGNSTFLDIENRAVQHENNIETETDNLLEIINESPTSKNESNNFSRTRSRLLSTNLINPKNDSKDESRRRLRKSKSDSKLMVGGQDRAPTKKNPDNYSELFDCDFTYNSMKIQTNKENGFRQADESLLCVSQFEAELGIKDNLETNTDKDNVKSIQKEMSMMHISQLEDGLDVSNLDNSQLNEALDIPICSDDVKNLLETTDTVEKSCDQFWRDSMDVEASDEHDLLANDLEHLQALDESKFICPIREVMEASDLTQQLDESKLQVKNYVESIKKSNQNTFKDITKKECSTSVQCEKSVTKKDLPVRTTKNVFSGEANMEYLKHISHWNLPPSILREYDKKGVIKMFDWQVECLSNPKVIFEHCNLVYSAPTSAGKTLVSEILLIKTVLERSKKVLLILPFISVVREKMFYLQELLTPAGYRVEGFFGGYTPPGGFDSIHVAICTIEKANSIVNKLLDQGKLEEIGMVVVDEIHLISDPGRGYILELLLAKILYMLRKYGFEIQVITMSATLANVELLKRWLDAELYITDYRPVALQEMIKIGFKIYDNKMQYLRDVREPIEDHNECLSALFPNDPDHVAQLCIETLLDGCSVIVFCPSKDWCENLAKQLAGAIHSLGKGGSELGLKLRKQLNRSAIDEMKRQLRDIPTGLDDILEKIITYGCAYHHAGLTTEERDIIEASFKNGALKIIVATSTLSSGVNLPARRVLIRSPLFGGKQMSSLTYKQMIGRAGRTGKDTLGESILICTDSNARIGRELVSADLRPISSCLEMDSSTHLKRALLEVIASSVANSKEDVERFVNCTLLSAQKHCSIEEKDDSGDDGEYINEALDFLIEYEFIRLQCDEEKDEQKYVATRLGLACLASSMPPTDGLILFSELQKSRRCFVLESELHAVYLVTPYSVCYQLSELDWLLFLDFWEKLTPAMRKVGEFVGVKESFLVRAMRGQSKLDYKLMQIHKRFYTALALQELVNETPINVVAQKYKCTRGMLQSLQQMASTFAGIVTAFCNSLQWNTLALIVAQFKERLYFGIHHELVDLMRLPDLSQKRARSLYDGAITSLIDLANSDVLNVEKILYNSLSFDSAKQHDDENAFEAEKRKLARHVFITGKPELTVSEAAKLLISEARLFVQYEIGAGNIKWSEESVGNDDVDVHMSCEEENIKCKSNENLTDSYPKQCKVISNGFDIENNTDKEYSMAEAENPPNNEERMCNEINDNEAKSQSKEIVVSNCSPVISKEKRARLDDSLNSPKPSTSTQALLTINRKKALEIKRRKMEEQKLLPSSAKTADQPRSPRLKREEVISGKKNLETKIIYQNQSINNTNRPPQAVKTKNENPPIRKSKAISPAKTKTESMKPPGVRRLQTLSQTKCSIERKPLLENKLQHSPINSNSSVRYSAPNRCIVETTPPKHINFKKNEEIENIFNNENDSFELNSQLKVVTNVPAIQADAKQSEEAEHDHIPNSQNIEMDAANSTADRTSSARHVSRFMRSYRTQKLQSPKSAVKNPVKKPSETVRPAPVATTKMKLPAKETTASDTSSIEVSDLSLENSLIKNPIQLNASHILSCSKEDTDASSFKSIDIIDICGNEQLFKDAFRELFKQKRFGCCLGLQQITNKRKPLIGGNLLINQMAESEKKSNDSILFQLDDSSYLSGIAFCVSDNIVFYMNLEVSESDGVQCAKVTTELKCKYLRNLFKSSDFTLLMYDGKEQLKILRKAIKNISEISINIEDPRIANWLLQPDHFLSLKQMAQQFAPECVAIADICGRGRGYNSYGLDVSNAIFAKIRSSIEACVTVHILKGQIENLERIGTGQLRKFFNELEMPLQLSLMDMEIHGFPVNETELSKLFQQMVDTMKSLENKIYELHGSKFNLGSSAAVGKVLGLHRKANGRVSTSRQILEKIDSPISQLIIAYRKLSTTLSKNIQPLLKCVEHNRIHGQSLTCTSTGRISMIEPNLQNVAKDFNVELGNENIKISCRSAFRSYEARRCLISADFCQLEMRILAHLSQDAALLQVMNSEADIFTAIAARWNKISESRVSEQLRNGTKQICYGIVYGMGMRALAESLKCTEQEATMVSQQFHAAYPGIRIYADKVVKFARNTGYIETITGRRRYLQNINSCEALLKSQAERQAMNSTIQGSAADIAKSAILRIEKNLLKYREKLGLPAANSHVSGNILPKASSSVNAVRFVLHLHDELLFEVPEDKAKRIAKVINLTMENCVKLNVPLKVKLRIGKSWGELNEVKV